MHGKYHVPLDFQVYLFDVEKANRNAGQSEPDMELVFDFKRDLDLIDLSPSSHAILSDKLLHEETLA